MTELGEQCPGCECKDSSQRGGGKDDTRKAIREVLELGARRLGLTNDSRSLSERVLVKELCDLDIERSIEVERAGSNRASHNFENWDALAGHRRLINLADSGNYHAVGGDLRVRGDPENIAILEQPESGEGNGSVLAHQLKKRSDNVPGIEASNHRLTTDDLNEEDVGRLQLL